MSKRKPAKQWSINVDVFCEGCGKVIVNLKRLLTPSDFKAKYGYNCPFCGREFNEIFKMTKKKRVEANLNDYISVDPDPGLVKLYEKKKKELNKNGEE